MVRAACGHLVKREDACAYEGAHGPLLVCKRCCRYCTPTRYGQSGPVWELVG